MFNALRYGPERIMGIWDPIFLPILFAAYSTLELVWRDLAS